MFCSSRIILQLSIVEIVFNVAFRNLHRHLQFYRDFVSCVFLFTLTTLSPCFKNVFGTAKVDGIPHIPSTKSNFTISEFVRFVSSHNVSLATVEM